MNITIKLFATLREGRGKILNREFSEGTTVKQLIDELKITEEDVAILLVNGLDSTVDHELKDGDVVSIFPPVGGG